MKNPCHKCIAFPACRQRLITIGINMVQYTDSLINGNEYMHKQDFIYIMAIKLTEKCSILKSYIKHQNVSQLTNRMEELRQEYGIKFHPEEPLY